MQGLIIKDNITTLELLEQINFFRKDIEGKSPMLHKNLLQIIRTEFEEEITRGEIQPVNYLDKKKELRPMFVLTAGQAKQVLFRESKAVRKAVIQYIENLEKEWSKAQSTMSYKERILNKIAEIELQENLQQTKTMEVII